MNYEYGIIFFVYDMDDERVFDRSYIGIVNDLNSFPDLDGDFEFSELGFFELTEEGCEVFNQWHEDASCGYNLRDGRMKGICREIGGTGGQLWNYLTERDYLSKRIICQSEKI